MTALPNRRHLVCLAIAALMASACTSLRYYGQAVRGGLGVALGAEKIERVLARPATDAEVARQLALVQELRRYAAEQLGLRVGKRYNSYLDLGRDVAVWNVVAAPELAVVPVSWCFPIAGCVPYRGYFRRAGAERFAARMQRRGFEAAITGATAYSTLGWLRDPVLNTFLGSSDARLAGLLFHELAHASLYAPGDAPFNESFATVVEEAGVRAWLEASGSQTEWIAYARHAAAERIVLGRLADLRDRLAALYASDTADDRKRQQKAATIGRFQADLGQAIAEQPDLAPWRGWAERPLNNADLAAVGVYWQWTEPLAARLEARGWSAFLDEMRQLAGLAPGARLERLQALEVHRRE